MNNNMELGEFDDPDHPPEQRIASNNITPHNIQQQNEKKMQLGSSRREENTLPRIVPVTHRAAWLVVAGPNITVNNISNCIFNKITINSKAFPPATYPHSLQNHPTSLPSMQF